MDFDRKNNPQSRQPDPVAPLTIGPRNAQHVLGIPWRWARDFAKRAGLPIWRVGGKSLIPAGPLVLALEAEAARNAPPAAEPLTDEEEQRQIAARLGLVRRKDVA